LATFRGPVSAAHFGISGRLSSDRILDYPVALDRITDLELHHGTPESSAFSPTAARSSAILVRNSPTTSLSRLLWATDGSSARTIKVSSPYVDKSLPRMISLPEQRGSHECRRLGGKRNLAFASSRSVISRTPHSHSMIPIYDNHLIYQRKFSPQTIKT
jgi:hypothetical protein